MTPSPRNPLIAAVLSIVFPGLGHLYAGRLARALAVAAIGLLVLCAIGWILRAGDIFLILLYETLFGIVFAIAVTFDAWRVTKRVQVEDLSPEVIRPATYFWYIALVLIGSVFLALQEADRLRDFTRSFRMAGHSMEPTLQEGDVFFVEHQPFLETDPEPGELVVYRSAKNRSQFWVGRVIALGGQTVAFRENTLYVDGVALTKAGPDRETATELIGNFQYSVLGMDRIEDFEEITVPPYQAFIAGDNRAKAFDSRYFGTISIATIDGSLRNRYWPRSRAGKLNVPIIE
ncbi:MAG: signal peptidase I [Verrucomicrobiota bacterium]